MAEADSKPIIEYYNSSTPKPLGSQGRWSRGLAKVALALAIFGGVVMMWTCVVSNGDSQQSGEKIGLMLHQAFGSLTLLLQWTILLPLILIFSQNISRHGQKALARKFCIGAVMCLVLTLVFYVAGCLPYPNHWQLVFWWW